MYPSQITTMSQKNVCIGTMKPKTEPCYLNRNI